MPASLLDRLTQRNTPPNGGLRPDALQHVRALKASLCEDLTALLNTRRAEDELDPSLQEAANSLLTFGIADFTSLNLTSSVDQERVRRSIERAIRQFEPRLTQISVVLEEPNSTSPVLHLRIEAILRAGPRREPVEFNAALSRDSRRIAVSGAER
jgi:type VI secretion system protein ImpF